MARDGDLPLFETKEAKGRTAFKLYTFSMFVGICLIWVYRATHIPNDGGRWAWIGMFGAEIWFGLYWIITQSVRWKPVFHETFKERLSQRYESELPDVDIFVCTADPTIEPPTVVINTILSVMAYDYPSEKLSIYLSDDGGSDLTFYALFEAAQFSRYWIPFCRKFDVEPRSPAAYFSEEKRATRETMSTQEWSAMKTLYKEMENRIEATVKLGRISEEISKEHKGFSEWNSRIASRNHHTILQILIDGRGSCDLDTEGYQLPTLVYLAREKRPQHPHNFKAGAMNALIRVSSEISSGQIILNVDCDMYANNSKSVRDALCFFMDEEKGHEIAYVQFPQGVSNVTKNDIYGNAFRIPNHVELGGMDGFGGPLYIGTGCFHRREILCGKKFSKAFKGEWKRKIQRNVEETVCSLEERAKNLASCAYEDDTQWGKEMGLKYGCAVEDIITGLSIQCRGWRSVFFSPTRAGFLGLAPTTLEQALLQHKRWSEGNFQVFIKHCSLIHGRGKIKLGLQMAYCIYGLWALNCFPTLYYVFVPSLYFLNGISLFPRISSLWFIPFSCVIMAKYAYSLGESLWAGDTLMGWWNDQRTWMMRRTTSYLFGFIDAILNQLGFAKSAFTITAKVADDEVNKRYEEELMEFGSSSPMFTILATLALFNLLCFVGGVKKVVMGNESRVVEPLALQILLGGLLVIINIPIYQGLFFRKDKGKMPTSITFTSLIIAFVACLTPIN